MVFQISDRSLQEKLEGLDEIRLTLDVLSQGFPRSLGDFQLTSIGKTISWRINGQKVECSLRSPKSAVLLVALIENGETDFSILKTKGRHKYIFARQNSIQVAEVSNPAIKQINQLIKYYSYVQQQSSPNATQTDNSRDSGNPTRRVRTEPQRASQITRSTSVRERIKTANCGSKESQDLLPSTVQLGSDSQDLPKSQRLHLSPLPGESAGRRDYDVARESAEFFSRLCHGVSSESEIVERLEIYGAYLAEKERRGAEDVTRGFQTLKAEPNALGFAAIGQILAGIGAQNQAITARGYTRQQLFYRRVQQLHQESTEHDRRVKEFYGSR